MPTEVLEISDAAGDILETVHAGSAPVLLQLEASENSEIAITPVYNENDASDDAFALLCTYLDEEGLLTTNTY